MSVEKSLDGLRHRVDRPEYRFIHQGRRSFMVRPGYENILGEVESARLAADGHLADTSGHGRMATTRFPLPDREGERGVIRWSSRGTFVKYVLGNIYLTIRTRMFEEARVTARAQKYGVPVAEVLAAARETIGPLLYRGWIVTREIPRCKDLRLFLESFPDEPSPSELRLKRDILAAAGAAVASMHDAGIYHWDLHIRNLLAVPDGSMEELVYIIDFDKSKIFDSMRDPARIRNLMRLFRSLVKRQAACAHVTRRDIERFLRAYFRGDRARRRTVNRLIRRHFWIIRLHGYWWRRRGIRSALDDYLF
jgi:tRNA A-37 threonylcarbamoyl transferase component Bud32